MTPNHRSVLCLAAAILAGAATVFSAADRKVDLALLCLAVALLAAASA